MYRSDLIAAHEKIKQQEEELSSLRSKNEDLDFHIGMVNKQASHENLIFNFFTTVFLALFFLAGMALADFTDPAKCIYITSGPAEILPVEEVVYIRAIPPNYDSTLLLPIHEYREMFEVDDEF